MPKKQLPPPPQTQGLFAGKYGRYYKDQEFTQYVGKVVNGQWVPAKPEDVGSSKKKQSGIQPSAPKPPRTQTPQPTTPKPQRPLPPRVQKKSSVQSTGDTPKTLEARSAQHLKVVRKNENARIDAIEANGGIVNGKINYEFDSEYLNGMNQYSEYLASPGIGAYTFDRLIPYGYAYAIQRAFGRKYNAAERLPIKMGNGKTWHRSPTLIQSMPTIMGGNAVGLYERRNHPETVTVQSDFLKELYYINDLSQIDGYDLDEGHRMAQAGLHILTHEMIHSVSPRLNKLATITADTSDEYLEKRSLAIFENSLFFKNETHVALEEGLTDFLARQFVDMLIYRNGGIPYEHMTGYPTEVKFIQQLRIYGDLDPLELFQTADSYNELERLMETHQRKYLTNRLIDAGFDPDEVQRFVRTSIDLYELNKGVDPKETRDLLRRKTGDDLGGQDIPVGKPSLMLMMMGGMFDELEDARVDNRQSKTASSDAHDRIRNRFDTVQEIIQMDREQ